MKLYCLSKKKVGRKPVFGIGLDGTGTTSLSIALSLLGYRCCDDVDDIVLNEAVNLIDNNEHLYYNAYINIKRIINKYIDLDIKYPEAVFILTTRQLDEWLADRVKREKSGAASSDPDIWIDERRKHHNAVLNYFKTRPKKLLVMDIYGGDEWEPLCRFLGCALPDTKFPNPHSLPNRQTVKIMEQPDLVKIRDYEMLKHDSYPWIMSTKKTSNFGRRTNRWNTGIDAFANTYIYRFEHINVDDWEILENTFPSNLAKFHPDNLSLLDEGGFRMTLRRQKAGNREYTSASIASKTAYHYGRFEVEMKPTKGKGVIAALFLYRMNPWQEIDLEFLGKDTTRILVNVYYNPGIEGTYYNYGSRGTPVLVDLGFDAADDFHCYTIEWECNELRWLADGELVHQRLTWEPTPIPYLPLHLHINMWPSRSEEVAGKLDELQLPLNCDVRSVKISH